MPKQTNIMFGQLRPAILDIAHVRKAGVLDNPGRVGELDIGIRLSVFVQNNTLHLIVPTMNQDICDQFPKDDKRFWREFEVKIVYHVLTFGERAYFVCPITGQDCLKLLVMADIVCSKSAYGDGRHRMHFSREHLGYLELRASLLKEDGSMRMSELERERLIAAIKKHPNQYRNDEAVLNFLKRHEQAQTRKQRRFRWESRPLSTTKGLDCGRSLGQHREYLDYLQTDPDWVDNIPPLSIPKDQPRGSTEDYPEFDIKALLTRIHLEVEGVAGKSLGWPAEATDGCSISMFLDGRREGLPTIVFLIRDYETGHTSWQKIDLLSGPTSVKARYFLCPITRACCETLYFRNRIFASARAHRLRKPVNWELSSSPVESLGLDDRDQYGRTTQTN